MSDNLDYLFQFDQFGIKFGLDNIRALAARLGHPERAYRTVHIAGTNGKGSVTAMIEAALRAAGHRTGRYTSPHLVDVRERFAIDGEPVSAANLDSALGDIRWTIDAMRADGTLLVQPTFFEVTTAVAFELFRRAQVDIAVVEVGLGGRLDATNIVSPEITAITSIGFDHEQFLGSTLAAIAREKAGIIKPDVPVVVGPLDPESDAVIAAVAQERHAPLVHAVDGITVARGSDKPVGAHHQRIRLRTPAHDYGDVDLALLGDHQIDNAVVAVRLLEQLAVAPRAIATGLGAVSWPGRLEVRPLGGGREVILDAAHNPAGAAVLASYLKAQPGARPALVFAVMKDKDVDAMMQALAPVVSAIVLTRAASRRAADPAAIVDRVRRAAPAIDVTVEPSPGRALTAALAMSPRVVVAGSIFLLGDLLPELDRT